MIVVCDPEIGVQLGFFMDGAYHSAPDDDGLISQIEESIKEHESAIIHLQKLKRICERLKQSAIKER